MAQRLLRVIVPPDERERLLELLEAHDEAVEWSEWEGREAVAVEVLIPARGTEALLDDLQDAFSDRDRFRILLLPVSAAIPPPREEAEPDEAEKEDAAGEEPDGEDEEAPGALRVSREELYSQVTEVSGPGTYYLVMVALAAVVASVGLLRNSPAVLVGAMVIAPLLGPNMALALATTLGDPKLGREAILHTAAGVGVALVIAVAWGAVAPVDPTGAELARATRLGYGELFIALAAGAAGVLSIAKGTATALVGVMVAVALLPPLVAAGVLTGAGFVTEAREAFLLVAANVIGVNLAAVVTFLALGVRPLGWREANRARRATWLALTLWIGLLVGLVLVILEAGEG